MPQQVTVNVGLAPAAQEALAAIPQPQRASAFDMVASQPWAITPAMLETICAIARRENDSPDAVEAKLGRPLQNTRMVTMRGSVALVPITGPIFRYANMFTDISGATSLDVLSRDFSAALENPAVSAIVLNIDSPGGQASGIAEFAQMVRAANKPVIAYVDGSGASAAYWIAAAAQQLVLSKTAEVGSIGAVFSVAQGKSKDSVEIVSSQSPNKRPDVGTAEGRSLIQARADKFAQVFIEDVAAYRGVSADTVLADFGQGDMRMGAEAVAAGMADRVSTLEEVIAGLSNSTPSKGAIMAEENITRDSLAQHYPQIVAALQAEGAAAERARIQDVEAQALPGHEALIAALKFDGATTGAQAAVQVLAAERHINLVRLDRLHADAPTAVPHAAAPADASAAEDKTLPIEERAQAMWDTDANLRAEFGEFNTYLAYAKAHDAGAVKILKSNKE